MIVLPPKQTIDRIVTWFTKTAGLPSKHDALTVYDVCGTCGKPSSTGLVMMGLAQKLRADLNVYGTTVYADGLRDALEWILNEVKTYGIPNDTVVRIKAAVRTKLAEIKQPHADVPR